MKHLSLKLLAETVIGRRKALKQSQTALSEKTGINRSVLSRLEQEDYSPSVDQLLILSEVLDFRMSDLPKDVKNCLPRREKTPYHVVAKSSYRAH